MCAPGGIGRCRRQAPRFGRQRGSVRVRNGFASKQLPSAFRGAAVIRAHRAHLQRAETERAWLPAPLVWTWVRAHRQLLAGNAGLRPATTSFPANPASCKARIMLNAAILVGKGCKHLPLTHAGAMGLRTRRNALCSNSSCLQKNGEICIVDCSTTFPRVSRASELRNREEAANMRTLLRLRFAENCADQALHDVPHCGNC